MNETVNQERRLPRCVHKYDLKEYFGCTYKYLWSSLITEDLLEEWGIDLDKFKRIRRIDPETTRKIYHHFRITDLDADYSEEINKSISDV